RPDLRRAERELAAETARIGVAQAGLYPRVSLLGSFSFDALRLARLAQHDATAFGVGPSIRWNLFDGGRVRSEIAAQRSVAAEMRAETEHTLREAVAEVESAADAFVREGERIEALRRSVRSARDSVARVLELYRNGLADFQRVLDSQRALFEQQDELAESEGRQVQSLIALYAALGGGF
nr:TolC family protein [Myxococcota bacterium]